jgi:hypothetical protein
MLRLLSIAALASAAIIAAIPNSPVFAAVHTINSVGTVRVSAVTNATGGGRFDSNTPVITGQPGRQGPKQRRWVCGPIVNWDGSPHCHWVP